MDTTRRYPRTLHGADAAFPCDPEYASAVHRCARKRMALRDLLAYAAAVTLALICAALWPGVWGV